MRWISYIAFIIANIGFSQVRVKMLYEEMPSDSIQALSLTEHSSILPTIGTIKSFKKTNTGYISKVNNRNYFRVHAITDLAYTPIDNQYRTGLGAFIETQFANKWFVRIAAIDGVGKIDTSFLAPKSFYFERKKDSLISYLDLRGRVSFTPNQVFNFQAGIDNNFIGEGNRSMLLSDYSVPAPFAQIRTKFWRLEYLMLYQFYREQVKSKWKNKYAATHYLSINATKWLNLGFFETVIFQPKDTTLNRGFDPEYLNPIIFYRPQEYSMGSSDNIILGFQISAKYKGHTVYAQAILDEFSLSELRKKTQWWGNKYGGQFGIKGRFQNRVGDFFYRTEFNTARPYTYSHSLLIQNYGNQGYSLANPYGGNFAEILGELKWQRSKMGIKFFASYFLKGFDLKDGLSYGGDIYQSYNNRPHEYYNKIGQGKGNNGVRIMLSTSYVLDASTNLQVFIENHFRTNNSLKEQNYYLVVGFRSCLWNDYRNY